MDSSDLKKVLAGLCMASLIAGSTFAFTACSSGKSA